jgi:hypothetical protein
LLVADTYSGTVKKFALGANTFTVLATDRSNGVYGLALDDSGNLFGTNWLENRIDRISATGFTPFVTTGLDRSFGLVFGPDPASSTAVTEPFTIVGTLLGSTAAVRLRKKLETTAIKSGDRSH